MRTIVLVARRLICAALVLPFLVPVNARTNEDSSVLSKSAKEPNVPSSIADGNGSTGKSRIVEDHGDGQSSKSSDRNSPALDKFLQDVLKARSDLRWIDQAVRNVNQEKGSENNHRNAKLREKRGSDRSYDIWKTNRNMYSDENSVELGQRANFDNDMTFKREMDFDDLDASQNGVNRRQDHPSVSYNKQTADDQVPSGWTKPKDLCSLNDWLNSNSKNPDVEQDKLDKLEDQWIHDRQGKQKNTLDSSDFDKTANAKADARLNVRNQRDETKKAGAPSLESLKETILELKKSLNEADVKQREDSKSVDTAKVGEEGSIKRNQKERRTHARSKHRKTEDDAEAISGWTGDPDTGTLDLRKRERVSEDPSERNARLKVWRTKRTEVNNDDSNRKLFHRAGFGAPYLEEDVLKELHDRKRRSKGTPSDEKHRLKEDKNNSGDDEKNSIRISKAAGCSDADASGKRGSPSNDPLETSKPTNDPVDTGSSVDALKERKGGVGNADETRNYEQSDLSRENSNAMGNELTKNEEKGESPQGNSLRTFEPVTNELRPVSRSEISRLSADARERAEEAGMQKTEENQENADSTKGEQVIKVFKPQERPYQNSERAKEVRGAEPDEDRGKLSQRPAEGRGPSKESGNINILLASENKNLLKFSNTGGGGGDESLKGEQPPFVLNAFDVKKKLFVENEDAPGKSVSTVFNVKIEKAQVDTPVKTIGERERNRKSDDAQFRGGAPDFGENKGNGVPYGDTPGSANNLKERNADEKRLTNSIESDKGAEQSGVNENGIRNWFEGAVPDQVGASVDRIAPEKCDDRNERDKFKNEGERLNDCNEKTDFAHGFNDKVESNDANDGRKDKKKYREIFIMNNGMDDRVMNDGLGKRKILQYMEYSNDDIEDVDQPYGDKEEEDSQQEIGAEKSDAPAIRKERSAYADKKKAKVNLLIKEKLKKKKGGRRGRKRRNPSVIEYYDYDSDSEQRDHEAMSPTSEQERTKNNYPDKNAIESDAGLADNGEAGQTCIPFEQRKSEHEEAILKEQKQREKLRYKLPKEQFLSPGIDIKNETDRTAVPSGSPELLGTVKLAKDEGSGSDQRPGSRSSEDEFLGNDGRQTALDPAKCIPKLDKNYDPGAVDDLLEDTQSFDEKRERISGNAVEPLYEELKKVYDWTEEETKSKPRVKGDQRMYYGANDKLDPADRMVEPFKEPEEIHGPTKTYASSPNLLPLLLARDGSGGPEVSATPYAAASPGRREGPANAGNASRSNYLALKTTDDMFKGGSEQSNSTGEKLRGPSVIGAAAEWRAQKVSGVRNGAAPGKDAAGWSLTNRGRYIDTDSRSPYENGKYLESQPPREPGRVRNIDREKQTVISSRDLHESFVEPLEWIDDFDEDATVRLSRSLKTVDANANIAYIESNTIVQEKSLVNGSTVDTVRAVESTTLKSAASKVALVARPSLDAPQLLRSEVRIKRDAAFPRDAIYDDANQRDEEVSNNVQLSNSYEDADDARQKLSDSNKELEEYDVLDDEDEYEKVARSANSKRKKHVTKKKSKKQKKRKGKSSKSRRKRRHRKKHSNDSKAKSHNKKHKKNASKSSNHHTNVKKSKASRNEEKGHGDKKEHRVKVKKDDTNLDSDTRKKGISSLLIADNMEDESQMGSALHGELAGKIVEQIFDQVQKNEVLKVSLGPGLYQKHKTRDTVAADKSYRQTRNDDEIKHTEELLNKIMLLLNQLIFDEVQRKTCVALPPESIEFLNWMLDASPQDTWMEQLPASPLIREGETEDHFPRNKFLFQSVSNETMGAEIAELYAKIRLLKSLIKEYSALADKDKAKIESIQDYLAKQLDLLLEYIEAKEEAEKKGKSSPGTGASRGKGASVLRYQIGTSNASNGSYSTRPDTFPPLMNAQNHLKPSNRNFRADEQLFLGGEASRLERPRRLRRSVDSFRVYRDPLHVLDGLDVHRRGRRTIRSLDGRGRHNKRQRGRKKRKRKHGGHRKGANAIDQSRQKDAGHKAAAVRQKREYLDQIFWDASDLGYEEPLIYSSMDLNVESNGGGDSALEKKESVKDKEAENARSWQEKTASDLKKGDTVAAAKSIKTKGDTSESVADVQSRERIDIDEDRDLSEEEEPITGRNWLEDEILLLNKRQAWKKKNEEQLEEVAFGEDMRRATRDKELFEELTEIDKKQNELNGTHARNSSHDLSNEDKLRMLEEKINVYADKRAEKRAGKK